MIVIVSLNGCRSIMGVFRIESINCVTMKGVKNYNLKINV